MRQVYNQIQSYTYRIKWSKTGISYYGVRWGHINELRTIEEDFWNVYKTSSKSVKDYIQTHGDPDIIQVRKIFETVEKAREWEKRVLLRLKVPYNPKWLNKNCFPAILYDIHPNRGGYFCWWNGIEERHSKICPGKGFVRGRNPKYLLKKGNEYWKLIKNHRGPSIGSMGPMSGETKRKIGKANSLANKGYRWYTDGIDEIQTKTGSPDENFRPGRKPNPLLGVKKSRNRYTNP